MEEIPFTDIYKFALVSQDITPAEFARKWCIEHGSVAMGARGPTDGYEGLLITK